LEAAVRVLPVMTEMTKRLGVEALEREAGGMSDDDVRICDNCGGEIIFRYMGGGPRPIHLSGG